MQAIAGFQGTAERGCGPYAPSAARRKALARWDAAQQGNKLRSTMSPPIARLRCAAISTYGGDSVDVKISARAGRSNRTAWLPAARQYEGQRQQTAAAGAAAAVHQRATSANTICCREQMCRMIRRHQRRQGRFRHRHARRRMRLTLPKALRPGWTGAWQPGWRAASLTRKSKLHGDAGLDHGYFRAGPTGLERIEASIAPLVRRETGRADVYPRHPQEPQQCPPATNKTGGCWQASGGNPDSWRTSNECVRGGDG